MRFIFKFKIYAILLLLFFNNKAYSQLYFQGNNLNEYFSKYHILNLDLINIYAQTKADKLIIRIKVNNLDTIKLELKPNQFILTNEYGLIGENKTIKFLPNKNQNHWSGYIKGTNGLAQFNIYQNCINGYIETINGLLYIETQIKDNQSVIFAYYAQDIIQKSDLKCGNDEVIGEKIKPSTKRNTVMADFNCEILKLSSVIAYPLFKKRNYDTLKVFNEIADIINLAHGIILRDLGIKLMITNQSISLDSNATYNTSNSCLDRISSFDGIKNKFKGAIEPSVYHLFYEYFNPIDNAAGRGYLGGACETNKSSVSMEYTDMVFRTKVLCHELGHNLNLDHSDGTNCSSNTQSIICQGSSYTTLYYGSKEINIVKTFLTSKKGFVNTKECFMYPVPQLNVGFELCNIDSTKIFIQKPVTLNTNYLFENYLQFNSQKDTNIWVKKKGLHTIQYSTDSINGKACYFNQDFYMPEPNFVVLNNHSTGAGSLGRAIAYANFCKGIDTIKFNIPELNTTIEIDTFLPPVAESCVIDGTTQKGFEYLNFNTYFQPKIVLKNKLPILTNTENNALEFSRNQYTIKGLEFVDFYNAINAAPWVFDNEKNKYWNYLNKDSFYNSRFTFLSNKFTNNNTGLYLNMQDYGKFKSNDQLHVGNGTQKGANVFVNNKEGVAIPYSDSSVINHNYFGVQPNSTSNLVLGTHIRYNTSLNAYLLNNYLSNSNYAAVNSGSTELIAFNNKIGINPFLKNYEGFYGSGFLITGYNDKEGNSLIGGFSPNQENLIVGQRKIKSFNYSVQSSISLVSANKVILKGNKILNCDTTGILNSKDFYSSYNYVKPVNLIQLDSISTNCITNETKVFGKFKPYSMPDTLELNFYSSPENSSIGREQINQYLGKKLIYNNDTNITFFTHTLNNHSINEGITYTITSTKSKSTSNNSNVQFSLNKKQNLIFKDTCLCPNKNLTINKNGLKKLWVNNSEVFSSIKVDSLGLYNITFLDNANCLLNYSLLYKEFPNYLLNNEIIGTDSIKINMGYFYTLKNQNNFNKWNNYKWLGSDIGFVNKEKHRTVAFPINNKSEIEIIYEIKDTNKCTYSISKKINNYALNINNHKINDFNIYPNPVHDFLFFKIPLSTQVSIYSIESKLIEKLNMSKEKIDSINISHLENGLYFIYVENMGYFKFIKI